MNINFELYKVFVSIATNGSMSKASQDLHVTQSAISQSLKTLENLLDVKLFERERRGLVLTSKGIELLKQVEEPIRALEISENKIKETSEQNILTIAASQILCKHYVLDLVKYFKHYNIRLLNHFSNKNTIIAVENDQCDFALLKNYDQPKKDTLAVKNIAVLNYVFFYNDKLVNEKDVFFYPVVIKDLGSKLRRTSPSEIEKLFNKFDSKIQVGHDEIIIDLVSRLPSVGFAPKEYLPAELKIIDLGLNYKHQVQMIFKPNNENAKKFIEVLYAKN